VNQFLWSGLINSKHRFRNNWHCIRRCSWYAHKVQMFTQHFSCRSEKKNHSYLFRMLEVNSFLFETSVCCNKVHFWTTAHAYESMLCLIPVFLFPPVYYVVHLGAWSLFTLYSAIKGTVDIYSFIHSEGMFYLLAKRNILLPSPFVFYVLRLTCWEFTRDNRRSSAYDHQARRTSQMDVSVLWCCNSEFMATNASPGMMNIRAHCRITSQR